MISGISQKAVDMGGRLALGVTTLMITLLSTLSRTFLTATIMAIFQIETGIELELMENEDVRIRFNSDSMEDLIIRRPRAPRTEDTAEARKLLAASLAKCICSTLLFLLKWAGIESRGFRATAEVVTAKDAEGRLCVDSINLTFRVDTHNDEETEKKIKRVWNLFKKGCLMSRSLERGMKINYTIVT